MTESIDTTRKPETHPKENEMTTRKKYIEKAKTKIDSAIFWSQLQQMPAGSNSSSL
jgi:hypothetical protein